MLFPQTTLLVCIKKVMCTSPGTECSELNVACGTFPDSTKFVASLVEARLKFLEVLNRSLFPEISPCTYFHAPTSFSSFLNWVLVPTHFWCDDSLTESFSVSRAAQFFHVSFVRTSIL